jgi:hypothetical protein
LVKYIPIPDTHVSTWTSQKLHIKEITQVVVMIFGDVLPVFVFQLTMKKMQLVLFLAVYLCLLSNTVRGLPSCATTTCTSNSDCPSFFDIVGYIPVWRYFVSFFVLEYHFVRLIYLKQCVSGACVNGTVAPTQGLGEKCDVSSELCRIGFCSETSGQYEAQITDGCKCTADDQYVSRTATKNGRANCFHLGVKVDSALMELAVLYSP